MSEGRQEWKVGVFVVLALALLGALILSFSKGLSPLRSTYELRLRTADVAGLKSRAGVLMAGVQVGNVTGIELAPDGRSVLVRLQIEERFRVYRDAQFMIEQSGLLGDQFIAIVPRENTGPVLRDGDEVTVAPSTDFKEMLRSTAGLITRLDDIAATLQSSARRIDQSLLSEGNLNALSATTTNLQAFSAHATGTLDRVDKLVEDNAGGVAAAVAELRGFTGDLRLLAADLRQVVATNADDVGRVVDNVESASASARHLFQGLNEGRGLVGGLLQDDRMRQDGAVLLSNLANASANLTLLSSNLNRYGLFYKPRKPVVKPETIYPGKLPFK